jgi:hypothetical protein
MAYTKYSLTPANNNAAPPDGAPEGMLPSAVNDTMRDMMAQIRDVGDGIRGGTYTMTAPVITGGSITGVALSGNTFTSPVISGGSINNTPIGATTASTGAFSTLSATGVTTVQAGTVSAPAITTTGDTNTGIFFPAADTIAFTEGGAESLRINSDGNVLIGNTSISAGLPANGSVIVGARTFLSSNSGDTQLGGLSGSNVTSFYANGAVGMLLNGSGGGVQVVNSISVGNATPTTSGAGITFPATQSASSDANTLDDYEEGTFDASFLSGGGSITINTTYNKCRYTKIGRKVTVNGFLIVSSVNSPTGPALITGLPFTIAANSEGDTYGAASLFCDGMEATATGFIQGYGLPSSTSIYLYLFAAGAVAGLAPQFKTGTEITFTFSYDV